MLAGKCEIHHPNTRKTCPKEILVRRKFRVLPNERESGAGEICLSNTTHYILLSSSLSGLSLLSNGNPARRKITVWDGETKVSGCHLTFSPDL